MCNIVTKERNVSEPRFANYKIQKDNRLVNCRARFTALEHRIILLAIVQIQKGDQYNKMYKVYIKDVLGKNNSTNYSSVYKAIDRIQGSSISIEGRLPNGKIGWVEYSFVIKAQGIRGSNYIEIQFHEEIQAFLFNLKGYYTEYVLRNVMEFKGGYSYRIYELCQEKLSYGWRKMSIKKLKGMFILDDEYKENHEFMRRVIRPSLREINQFSDLQVSCNIIKQGRLAGETLLFTFYKKRLVRKRGYKPGEVMLWKKAEERYLTLGYTEEEFEDIEKNHDVYTVVGVINYYEKKAIEKKQKGEEISYPKQWIKTIFARALKDPGVRKEVYEAKFLLQEPKLTPPKAKAIKDLQGGRVEKSILVGEISTIAHRLNRLKVQPFMTSREMEALGASNYHEAVEILKKTLKEKEKAYYRLEKSIDKIEKIVHNEGQISEN